MQDEPPGSRARLNNIDVQQRQTKETENAAQDDPGSRRQCDAWRRRTRTEFRIRIRILGRPWLERRMAPSLRPGLCRPGLRRLHGAALGLYALRTCAALGQSLLLIRSRFGTIQRQSIVAPA